MKKQLTIKRVHTVKPSKQILCRAQEYFDKKWADHLIPEHRGEFAVVNPDLDICIVGISPGPTIGRFLQQARDHPFKVIRIGYDTRASFAGFEK